ncbi:hypothetical protein ACA910_009994 [Epithemia clementina (nom. ined.)]
MADPVDTTTTAPSVASPSADPRSDEDLLKDGTRLCEDDQILPGGRLLRQIKDTSLLKDSHHEFLRRAALMEKLREELTTPTSQGWKKQGESHGHRDFIVYYKFEDGGKLYSRIESVIESSLYVPFIATMNETDLYETWFPSWRFPFKLGINRSIKLKQRGRCEQVVQLTVDLPFPMNKREIVFWGFAEEDAELNQNAAAKLVTVDESFENGDLVPPPERGIVRMEFDSSFLFRPCPPDHPALLHSKGKYPDDESKILLTSVLYCDPKVNFVPHAFLNFVTRYAIGSVWRMILKVSEEVREGKRPAHAERMASKREEIYDWLHERAKLITGEGLENKTATATASSSGEVTTTTDATAKGENGQEETPTAAANE